MVGVKSIQTSDTDFPPKKDDSIVDIKLWNYDTRCMFGSRKWLIKQYYEITCDSYSVVFILQCFSDISRSMFSL